MVHDGAVPRTKGVYRLVVQQAKEIVTFNLILLCISSHSLWMLSLSPWKIQKDLKIDLMEKISGRCRKDRYAIPDSKGG